MNIIARSKSVFCLVPYTVKLARAKWSSNAGNFTCNLQVNRLNKQFTCVTCSLHVKTGKFTHVYVASTSLRRHAKCLQPQLNLPEHNGYFTDKFTCETQQTCSRLACKIACVCRQKYMQFPAQNTRIADENTRQTQSKITVNANKNTRTIGGKHTRNCTQNYLQLQSICYHTAG